MSSLRRVGSLTVLALVAAAAAPAAQAQVPGGAYPRYPQQYAEPAQPPRMRDLFAASLAAALTGVGNATVGAVAQGVTGNINSWFSRRNARATGAAMPGYGAAAGYGGSGNDPYGGSYPASGAAGYPPPDPSAYPNPGGAYPPAYPPASPGNPAMSAGYADPGTAYPGDPAGTSAGMAVPGAPAGYPSGTSGYPDPTNAYPSSSAYPPGGTGAQGAGYPASTPAYPGASDPVGGVYAGVAYEIQALRADGSATRVDPATYVFRGGDRFRIDYRPSLPGQLEVLNQNPAGQLSTIDSVSVGGGALQSLGPYEFTAMAGTETLIIRLMPCSTPALMTQTRDIVKVRDGQGAQGGGLPLPSCNATATRGLRHAKTRDIRKVSVEGGTSFALDRLAPGELASGQLDARQITITLQHR
jgi:hypothetical protein